MSKDLIVGIDEAGRGPLAGPVMAAAVILDPKRPIVGLKDSKLLTKAKREALCLLIQESALYWAVGSATVEEIDQINILQATMLAMQRAVEALGILPTLALVDGNRAPLLPCQAKTIIQGDKTEPAISAASIIAKVTRDREMLVLDQQFPHYGFAQHMGYGTKGHLEALSLHGPTIIHRKSFAPVAASLNILEYQ